MHYLTQIRIQNRNIDIDIDHLDIDISLDLGGAIEAIRIDGQTPTDIETDIINDNLQLIREEIAWQRHEQTKRKYLRTNKRSNYESN